MPDLNEFVVIQHNADDIKTALRKPGMLVKEMPGGWFNEGLFGYGYSFFRKAVIQAAPGFYLGKDDHILNSADDINFFMAVAEVEGKDMMAFVDQKLPGYFFAVFS